MSIYSIAFNLNQGIKYVCLLYIGYIAASLVSNCLLHPKKQPLMAQHSSFLIEPISSLLNYIKPFLSIKSRFSMFEQVNFSYFVVQICKITFLKQFQNSAVQFSKTAKKLYGIKSNSLEFLRVRFFIVQKHPIPPHPLII